MKIIQISRVFQKKWMPLGFAGIFAIIGASLLLFSRAATPSYSAEAETGSLVGGASVSVDSTASDNRAVLFNATATPTPTPTPTPGGSGTITHGADLTINDVGPWKLQGVPKGQEVLQDLTPTGRLSLHPNWGRPSWIPATPYVYNNNPNNHGGIVPAGGLTIDGYFVPAGTWVAQFYNFKDGVVIEGNYGGAGGSFPGVLFRGNRMRGNWGAPGWVNFNAVSNGGITWLMYNDAGGTSYVPPNICESIFESKGYGNDKMYVIRNYLTVASTLVFLRNDGDMAVENYGGDVTRYYPDDTYHLNGIANGGGEDATMWLRNHLDFDPQPGSSPYYKPQNDVIQMAADGGAYMGTATNYDGTPGYQIRDNFLAGAEHVLQLGLDKSNTANDVRNVVVTGNKFSTKWFQNSGNTAISYKNPVWNTLGNTWSNNTWFDDYGAGTGLTGRQYPNGDGPRKGQQISAP
jgi:hypothetical protein